MVSLTFWGLATFGGGGGVVTFEGSLLSELYGSYMYCPNEQIPFEFQLFKVSPPSKKLI